jgi:hypothetical protein
MEYITTVSQPPPARRGLNWISLLFGAISIILFALAAWMAWPMFTGGGVVVPTAVAGQLQAVHVTDALADQGLRVEQNQGFVPRGVFSVPGQGASVDGAPLYIFIFPDAATAATELEQADPAAIGPRGTPTPDVTVDLFGHSNVVVALLDAPDEVRTKVEQAVAGLP